MSLNFSRLDDLMRQVPVGSTGTRIYAGYIYEEYLNRLTGLRRAYEYDRMRRSCAGIGQALNAVINSLISTPLSIEKKARYKDDSLAEKQKEIIHTLLFDNMESDFSTYIARIAKFCIYGYTLFEPLWMNDNIEGVGRFTTVKDLLWRSPKTIWEWHVDDYEKLEYVVQRSYGDHQHNSINIPASNLLHFAVDQEGLDFEGISCLRRVYGAWRVKQDLLKILAIGSLRFSLPSLAFKYKTPTEAGSNVQEFAQALEAYAGGESSFLLFSQLFDPVDLKANFNPEPVIKAINLCNEEIAKEVGASFLELKGAGSYALGTTIKDFFFLFIESKLSIIKNPYNRRLIPQLVKYNFAGQPQMVELCSSPVGKSVSKEYLESLTNLTDKMIITPDTDLESYVRKNLGLPEQMEEIDLRRVPNANKANENGANGDDKKDDDNGEEIPNEKEEFSRKGYSKPPVLIRRYRRTLKQKIESLVVRYSGPVIEVLAQHWKDAKTDEEKLKLPKLKADRKAMRKELVSEIQSTFQEARTNAVNELKSRNRKKGGKPLAGLFSIASVYSDNEAGMIADIVGFEIEDMLGGSYTSLALDAENYEELEERLTETTSFIAQKRKVKGKILFLASDVVSQARKDLNRAIQKRIVSYTYHNDDPVTDYCKFWNGKTRKVANYPFAPHHWGCDGYDVPNLKEWKDNPEPFAGDVPKGVKKPDGF